MSEAVLFFLRAHPALAATLGVGLVVTVLFFAAAEVGPWRCDEDED